MEQRSLNHLNEVPTSQDRYPVNLPLHRNDPLSEQLESARSRFRIWQRPVIMHAGKTRFSLTGVKREETREFSIKEQKH
jgi:hypothetical protein